MRITIFRGRAVVVGRAFVAILIAFVPNPTLGAQRAGADQVGLRVQSVAFRRDVQANRVRVDQPTHWKEGWLVFGTLVGVLAALSVSRDRPILTQIGIPAAVFGMGFVIGSTFGSLFPKRPAADTVRTAGM